MKKLSLPKILIAIVILAILYHFVGQDFLTFYTGGKTELLATAAQINQRCNADGACPGALEGWKPLYGRADALSRGKMLYFFMAGETNAGGGQSQANRNFKLVYQFFMPDDWFEAKGGVGQTVTSGWAGR